VLHHVAGRAAQASLLEIEGAGHVVQHNRAAEVAEAILDFAGPHAAAVVTPQENPA